MAAAEGKKYTFGLADYIFDEGLPTEIRFDGKLCDEQSLLQADGGEITLEPETEDITLKDFGETPFDQIITGWNGTVTIVGSEATLRVISRIVSGTVAYSQDGQVVSVTDAPIGSSLRDNARTLRIHPRQMGDDTSEDIFIHKIANSSGYTRTFDNEQGQHEMEFLMFPKDCADANKPNNFFYFGDNPEDYTDADIDGGLSGGGEEVEEGTP